MLNDTTERSISTKLPEKTPPQKYVCNQCKFMFYNSNICLRCGSFNISMMIED